MNNSVMKKASIAAMAGLLPFSAAAEVSISGWINEGMTYMDDGTNSAIYQESENGHTLGSRITFAGSSEIGAGLTAGFEVIIEPQSTSALLGSGSRGGTTGTFGDESVGGPDGFLQNAGLGGHGHDLTVLGNSLNVSGGFGKVTVGLQSMPTDNIAVLEDPSLTLWSTISPIFVGNAVTIQGLGAGATNATWGSFLQCGSGIGGIGIDCNGIYRKGIRYDLPAFGPVSIAIGYANDDIYDVAAKYKGELAGIKTQLAVGYAYVNPLAGGAGVYGQDTTDNFQVQLGLMDPGTGIFGSFAYQYEDHDSAAAVASDDTNAWWTKVGIKKAFNSLGDTSFAFNYGQYNDQFGTGNVAATAGSVNSAGTPVAGTAAVANPGITGSEVERIGFEVNQYFGSSFILYGVWEMLDLEVDGNAATQAIYGGAEELNSFRMGATYFF